MKYFDIHTHTNSNELRDKFNDIVQEVIEKDIGLNIVGTTLKDSYIAIEQSRTHENFYCSVGIHPNEVDSHNIKTDIKELEQMIINNKDKIKCLGECGLDFHYGDWNKQWQEMFLIAQIDLAIKHNLTLMIHVRDAYNELIEILDTFDLSSINVIIHCFSANKDVLALFIKRNFFISISGIVTYKNATDLQEAVLDINLNYLLTETDSPYLAPSPHRGETNYPYNIKFTNSYIAYLLGIETQMLNKLLVNNAMKALRIETNDENEKTFNL